MAAGVAGWLLVRGGEGARGGPTPREPARAPARPGHGPEQSSRAPERPRRAERAPAERRASARPHGEVVVRAAYGSAVGELGVDRPEEGSPEGPMSFDVDARGRVHVLDQVNSRVQVFERGEPPRAIALPADTFQDIAVGPDGRAVVLDRLATGTLAFLDADGKVDHTVPLAGPNVPEGGAVTALFSREDGVWVEIEHASLVRIADERGEPDRDRPLAAGRFSADGASVLRAALDGPAAALVTAQPVAGRGADFAARVAFELPILGIRALDSDRAGRSYLTVNLVREEARAPFDVIEDRALVVVLAPDGSELRRVEIAPPQGPEEQQRPVRVAEDGGVYQLVLGNAAATIERFAR